MSATAAAATITTTNTNPLTSSLIRSSTAAQSPPHLCSQLRASFKKIFLQKPVAENNNILRNKISKTGVNVTETWRCFAAMQKASKPDIKKKSWNKWHWTHEEDNLLSKLVKTHGPGNWDCIARHLQRRTGKSCRLRWINQLNPDVDKTRFSEEDQKKLIQLQRQFGNRWAIIASFFPGRTDNQVKNQYHVFVGNRYKNMRRSNGSSGYGSISTVDIASQFVNVPYGGYGYFVLAPCFNTMPQSYDSVDIANSAANYQFIDFMGVGSSD